jgi:hypothetical protein
MIHALLPAEDALPRAADAVPTPTRRCCSYAMPPLLLPAIQSSASKTRAQMARACHRPHRPMSPDHYAMRGAQCAEKDAAY